MIIVKADIPDNEECIKKGQEALDAQKIFLLRSFPSNQSSTQLNQPKKVGLGEAVSTGLSIVDRLIDIRAQNIEIQKEKRAGLLSWLEKYYVPWPNWNNFIPQKPPETIKKVTIMRTTQKNGVFETVTENITTTVSSEGK